MASTINVARLEQAEVPDETKMAGDSIRDEVHGLTPRHRPFIAVAKVRGPSSASDKQSAHRKDAFDKLLLVSFGSISPAYSFIAFSLKS